MMPYISKMFLFLNASQYFQKKKKSPKINKYINKYKLKSRRKCLKSASGFQRKRQLILRSIDRKLIPLWTHDVVHGLKTEILFKNFYFLSQLQIQNCRLQETSKMHLSSEEYQDRGREKKTNGKGGQKWSGTPISFRQSSKGVFFFKILRYL